MSDTTPERHEKAIISPKSILMVGIPLLIFYCAVGMPQVGKWLLGKLGLVGAELDIGQYIYHFVIAFLILGIIPYIWLLKKVPSMSMAQFGGHSGNKKLGLILVLIGLIVGPVVIYFGSTDPALQAEYPLTKNIMQPWALFILYELLYVLLYYTAYEFFFRGFLQLGLSKSWPKWQSILLVTFLTTFIHWIPMMKPLSEIVGAFAVGFLFGYIAEKTDSWYYVCVIHFTIGVLNDTFCTLRILGMI
jgi:membrane protease YdiL (CAAX protease family)